MSNQELQSLVEQVSLAAFHRPFVHQARFNARLRTTGGRFHLPDENLDFNPTLFAHIDAVTRQGIIKHELCHYHLYRAHQGYRHRDAAFKQLLAAVGGLRYAPRITPIKPPKYLYQCTGCGQLYPRQRRLDLRRYACGRCGHRLVAASPAAGGTLRA
ncbi:SprT family protein [Lacticaseibacillus sp. 53-4]|uniref:SprT family protein n=1 Tax=Lacticaseibacillus sp. 53-4 TaxID=2799575 RepID=UPI0019413EB0|nr:SprT family protein [Lacticaseibacillus sp. 53-4]